MVVQITTEGSQVKATDDNGNVLLHVISGMTVGQQDERFSDDEWKFLREAALAQWDVLGDEGS